MRPYRYVVRIDQPGQHTKGWQARPPGRRSRLFSDSKHGGEEGAYLKAMDYVLLPFRQVVRNELETLAITVSTGQPVNLRRIEERIMDAVLGDAMIREKGALK